MFMISVFCFVTQIIASQSDKSAQEDCLSRNNLLDFYFFSDKSDQTALRKLVKQIFFVDFDFSVTKVQKQKSFLLDFYFSVTKVQKQKYFLVDFDFSVTKVTKVQKQKYFLVDFVILVTKVTKVIKQNCFLVDFDFSLTKVTKVQKQIFFSCWLCYPGDKSDQSAQAELFSC